MNHFFYHLLSFIIGIFFICFGIICLFIPNSESKLNELVLFIIENPWLPYLASLFFLTIGVVVFINTRLNSKKHYYKIKAGNRVTVLDEKIFEQYLDTYWKELFPKSEIPSRASIKNNKLTITADLPFIPLSQQRPLIQQIEQDLNEILIKYLGYHQEYFISINFQPEN